MGRSYTPTFRVETVENFGKVNTYDWPLKGSKFTQEKIEEWRIMMNASFAPNGCNAHIAESIGYVPHISHAKLIRQSSGKVVLESVAPMFEVV